MESNAVTVSCKSVSNGSGNKWLKIKKFIMTTVFLSLTVFAWIVFALPVIIYHIPQDVNIDIEQSSGRPLLPPAITNFSCSEGFYLNTDTGLCTPQCGEWKEFSESTVVTFDATIISLYVIHALGAVLAIVLSVYRYKYMLKFPSVLLVYYLIPPLLYDVLTLIGFAGRDSLFCQSKDLLETLDNPTAFCTLTGVSSNYLFSSSFLFQMFHILFLFWKVWFPIHARTLEKSRFCKYIHIAVIILALSIPWIPVGVAFRSGGYTIPRFPPFNNCIQRSPDALLYSYILFLSIGSIIEITSVLLVIWKLVNGDMKQPNRRKSWCTCNYLTAEVKLVIIFLYFTLALGTSLTLYTVTSTKITEYEQGFGRYFLCEAFGFNPDYPCVFELDRRGDQIFIIISHALYVFAPLVSLIYILHVEGIKSKVQALKKKHISSSGL